MTDDTNSANPSTLDVKANADIQPKERRLEQYSKNADGDRIANIATFDSPSANGEQKSWTLSEIERIVAQETLPVSKQKLGQFAIDLSRRNDFRLRDVERKFGRGLRQTFEHEIKSKNAANRVRDFDIQSQTLRMVTTNAAIGSLQFQRQQVLPYMRKSLALSYKKVDLLKRVVAGVGNLETALVGKLEAIKMNTASLSPKKESIIARLKKAISEKNIDRVATNFSDFTMDEYEKRFKTKISPLLTTLRQKMTKVGQGGGINGVNQAITGKLNQLRHLARKDPATLTPMENLQAQAAQRASGLLSGLIRLGHKAKLPGEVNEGLSKFAAPWTERVEHFNPFAKVDTASKLMEDNPTHPIFGSNGVGSPQVDKLVDLTRAWRGETKRYQKASLDHLTAIRQQVAPGGLAFKGRLPGQTLPTQQAAVASAIVQPLVKKLDNIDKSIQQDTKDRTAFERGQVKHQTLMQKLAQKVKIRKGSYEDQQEQRKQRTPAAPWGPKSKATVGGLFSALNPFSRKDKEGDDEQGGIFATLKEKAAEKAMEAKEAAMTNAKEKGSRAYRKAKIAMRRRMRARAASPGRAGRALGFFGKAGKIASFAKGPAAFGIAAGIGNHFLQNSDMSEGAKSGANSLLTMAQYGGIGAQIGGPWGAAAGAAVGFMIQNSDYASDSLKYIGDKASSAANGLVTGLFGQKVKFDRDGQIVQEHKTSLMEELKIAVFGRKATYSRSGEMITSERSNIIGGIKYGFEKLLFGDRYSNGDFKEGTSIADIMRNGIRDGMVEFGRQMTNLPKDLSDGFKKGDLAKGFAFGKNRLTNEIEGTRKHLAKMLDSDGKSINKIKSDLSKPSAFKFDPSKFTLSGTSSFINAAAFFSNPTAFLVNMSNATAGWMVDSGYIDKPSSPFYEYATEVLNAYGIRKRDQYRYINSVEITQEKINQGQASPFNDADMAYMASRMGFDPKNKDAVEYFKLWYKRRFLPGMNVVGAVLKEYKLTFATVLSANSSVMPKLASSIKRQVAASGLLTSGLELDAKAFNRFSKTGSTDPGQVTRETLSQNKPYDPRDPNSRQAGGKYAPNSFAAAIGSRYGQSNITTQNSMEFERAKRFNAQRVKGDVKDQPLFRQAFQKLPPNIRKVVAGSKSLQFALWSAAIQHGPDTASKIFQSDYSDKLDNASYLRSIYQDRSKRFGNLGGDDRTDAMTHMSQEMRFAMDMESGTSRPTMDQMYAQAGTNIVAPSAVSAEFAAVKSVIQGRESKGNYNVVVYGLPSPKPITTMSLGELFDWQRTALRARTRGRRGPGDVGSTGVGAYQFESMTLKQTAEKLYGSNWRSQIFTRENQDMLAQTLYNSVKGSPTALGNTWHAFNPSLNGGRSAGEVIASARRSFDSRQAPPPPPVAAPVARNDNPARPQPKPKPQAQPAPKPKAALPPPQTHDMSQWAAAMDRNTAAINKAHAAPLAKKTENTIVSPITNYYTQGNSGFLSMSMRKTQIAAGETG